MSPGAKESVEGMATGMVTGGVIGAAVGAVSIPFTGPIGPAVAALVGAHLGSLAGSMSSMKESGESEEGNANALPQRKSGMMVAVCLPNPAQEDNAVLILQAQGAKHIERAEGTISDGNWIDFDPLTHPVLVKPEIEPAV